MIYRDGYVIKEDDQYKQEDTDAIVYCDKVVIVPGEISKEEAEKLIKEKRAYPYYLFEEVNKLKEEFMKNNKEIYDFESSKNFSDEFRKEIRNLKKRIRTIDENLFVEQINQNKEGFKKLAEQDKKRKKLRNIINE